jgi:thiol-disulfide isomerase/thioredoxin
MQGIDNALNNGPVLIEFWTSTCTYCKQQADILNQLKGQYPGVSFQDYDANANRDLARAFGVSGVPTMSVIVKKNSDGSYTYAGPGGSITNDRIGSRFVGLTSADELKKALNAALGAR